MRAAAIAFEREMPNAVVFFLLVTVAFASAKEINLGKLENIMIIIYRIIQVYDVDFINL